MKKSSKPIIFIILTLLLILTTFALVRIGVKIKYEQIVVQKIKLENNLKTESNRRDKLKADFESLISEERIVAVAKSDLGMIRNIEAPLIIKYENQKVESLRKTLKEKYE